MNSMNIRNNLKILTWNIRCISTTNALGQKSLKTKVQEIYHKFVSHDIVCLQETWCTDDEARSLEDENFKVLFSNRKYRDPNAKRISGGVIVMVKKHIWKGVKKMLSSSDDVLWIKLDKNFFKSDRDIFLACSYLPPQGSSIFAWYNVDVCEMLELDVMRYSNMGDIMICGDLNARVDSLCDYIENDDITHSPVPSSYEPDSFAKKRFSLDRDYYNDYGKWLIDLCISARLAIVNGRCLGDVRGVYTSHQPEGASVVDYNIVSKTMFDKVNSFTVQSLTDYSDHCPLSLSVKMHKPQEHKDDTELLHLPSRYIWNDDSGQKLLNELSMPETCNTFLDFMKNDYASTACGVDAAVEDFESIIHQTAKKCIKRKTVKQPRKYRKRFVFNQQCYTIRQQLHYVRNLLERYPQNREIRKDYYSIKRMYEKSVKGSKSSLKNELLEKLDSLHEKDSKQYWDIFNKIRKNKNESVSPVSPSDWVEHYKQLCSKPEGYDEEISEIIKKHESQCDDDSHTLDQKITDTEIYDVIKKMKNNKSPGPDAIINEIIKVGKFYIVPLIKKIFNLTLEIGYFPKSWRKGYLINILKSGCITDPNNYRGITLTSCVGKLFSSIMNARLVNFLDVNKIYSMFQFGFREDCCTTDNVYILNKVMASYRNKKRKLYMCYIDFKKAFDKVWRAGLLLKILKLGITGKFYQAIKSMYTENFTAVKVNGRVTDFFECSLGVRQGDSLSPTLFNLYINDLGHMFNTDDSEPAMYGDIKVGCLMYADDLVILSDSKKGMQNSLNKLSNYCKKWKLEINVNKSKIMIGSQKKAANEESFYIDTQELEQVHTYKYLGLEISSNGSMHLAQDRLAKQGLKAWFYIRNNLYSAKVWPVNVFIKSFDTVVKPIILYGSEIWGQNMFMNKDGKILQYKPFNYMFPCERANIRVCKQILGVPSQSTNIAVLAELGRFPLSMEVIRSIFKRYSRLEGIKKDCLLKHVYMESVKMDNSLQKLITHLCNMINFPGIENVNLKEKSICKSMVNNLRQRLIYHYEKVFFDVMNSDTNRKLCTYKHFKKAFKEEHYLICVENPVQRKMLTRFRISAHNLYIERGRYKKVERENRICNLCTCNEIEDEFHFFMKCSLYEDLRNKYIKELVLQYDNPYSWQAFLYVMQLSNAFECNKIATFVYEAMTKRNSHLHVHA